MKNRICLLLTCCFFVIAGTSFNSRTEKKQYVNSESHLSTLTGCSFMPSPYTVYTSVSAQFATPGTYGYIELTFTCPYSSSIWETEILGTISGSGCIPSAQRIINTTDPLGRSWVVTINTNGDVYIKGIYNSSGNNASPYETIRLYPISYLI